MVTVSFSKRDLIWFVPLVMIMVVGFVVAFGDYSGNEAQINGHSSDEIMVKNSTGGLVTLQSLIDGGIGGGNAKSVQVVGTSNIQAGTSWADMSNMVITMDVGGDVFLSFSGNIEASGNTNVIGTLRFLVDGVSRHQMATEAGDGAWQNDFSMQWIEKGLSSGTHTFKVQWKGTNSNVQQDGATYPRVFSAIGLTGLNSGGSSGLSCHTVTNTGDLYSSEVQCDYGIAVSGSCSHVDFVDCANSPFSEDIPKNNGWRCRAPECWQKNVISYVVCCE